MIVCMSFSLRRLLIESQQQRIFPGKMTDDTGYTVQKMLNLFGSSVSRKTVLSAERHGAIPKAERSASGSVQVRKWPIHALPQLGERYGYIKKPECPLVMCIYTSKGGVLKSTLALNIARTAAMHNIRTCIVGLDLQCDITTACGFDLGIDNASSIEEAFARVDAYKGLYEYFEGNTDLESIIFDTELPTLMVLPENPELELLEQKLTFDDRGARVFNTGLIPLLKKKFDLVLLDCGPSWNRLVSNALAACDVLVSPLECKVTNYRNLRVFQAHTRRFREKLVLDYEQIFVPTLLNPNRKLSGQIRQWYSANLDGCTAGAIRESAKGEDAQHDSLSLPEAYPTSLVADEMRELMKEIWNRALEHQVAARKVA